MKHEPIKIVSTERYILNLQVLLEYCYIRNDISNTYNEQFPVTTII